MGAVTASNSSTAFPNQLHGAGRRQKMVYMNLTGLPYLRLPKPAVSWYHTQVQERLCEALQMQKGCTSVHSSVCM